ncbi:hypothetical protein AVEN_129963-1, partial [Araneus ventricosus]
PSPPLLLHRCLPQDDRKFVGRGYRENPHFCLKKLYPESAAECNFEGLEAVPADPVVNEIVSFAKIMGLELDKNNIDKLVKEHSQELTTEESTWLHWVSQQEDVEESLSEEEKVTAQEQSSGATNEMLMSWEIVVFYIENHHPNKAIIPLRA